MLRASANRALDGRRSDERTRLSFAKSDDDVGLLAREAPAAKPRQTTRSVGQIALLPDLVACCERRQIARSTDGGVMSEPAFRSRRATTTSDCLRAMRQQQSPDKQLGASGKSRSYQIWSHAASVGKSRARRTEE